MYHTLDNLTLVAVQSQRSCVPYSLIVTCVLVDLKPQQKAQTSDDDNEVVMRRSSTRSKNTRPKSLCDLQFMRSASDVGFNHKPSTAVLERRASCTDINNQSKLSDKTTSQRQTKESSDSDLSPTDSNLEKETFWEKVGARKLLSRKKNAKPRPLSGGLSDLQTVSTDKILELYARESRGSTSRINSLITEEDETSPSMGRRTMSSIELKSHAYTRESSTHASFRETRSNFQPLSDFRMSERYTPSTSRSSDHKSGVTEEKRQRPVAKPRLKLRASSETNVSKQTVESFTVPEVHRTVKEGNLGNFKEDRQDCEDTSTLDRYGYKLDKKYGDTQDNQEDLECTDVSKDYVFHLFNMLWSKILNIKPL